MADHIILEDHKPKTKEKESTQTPILETTKLQFLNGHIVEMGTPYRVGAKK